MKIARKVHEHAEADSAFASFTCDSNSLPYCLYHWTWESPWNYEEAFVSYASYAKIYCTAAAETMREVWKELRT